MLTSGKSLTVALTPKGRKQASCLGQALALRIKEGSEVVICSSTALALKINQIELSKESASKLPLIVLDNCDIMVMKVPRMSSINDIRVITHIRCGLED